MNFYQHNPCCKGQQHTCTPSEMHSLCLRSAHWCKFRVCLWFHALFNFLSGRDAFKFLQGLTTNDLSILQHTPSASLYANMLNVQGRVAFDVMISSPPSSPAASTTGHSYWLDCSADVVPDMQQFLQVSLITTIITITSLPSLSSASDFRLPARFFIYFLFCFHLSFRNTCCGTS